MIIINPDTRQFNVPGAELVFGVESDAGSERKYFQCPRRVGDNLDLASCFVRVNFRNAQGDMDSYLVDDVTVDGDDVTFSWVLSEKAVKYKGHVKFVVCVVGPNQRVEWHTTLGSGMVLEGLEPEVDIVAGTTDVVAQLVAMVEAQTAAVKAEGTTQIKAVQTAAKTAETASVAEIEAKGVNTRESIPDDYTALSEVVDGLTRGCAGAIVCEAAGSAVVVSDASDNYIQGLRIFGRSTQDGTPTPEAPVEIKSVENPVVTVCGKNLVDLLVGSTAVKYGSLMRVKDFRTIKKGNRYTISVDLTANDATKAYWNNGHGVFGYIEFEVTPGTKRYTRSFTALTDGYLVEDGKDFLNKHGTDDGVAIEATNAQIEAGDVATEYESYSGQTVELTHALPGIPVTSGGNYTDSDGQQWICDEVDLERGVYVQRCSVATLAFTYQEELNRYRASLPKPANAAVLVGNGIPLLCDKYVYAENAGAGTPQTNGIRIAATAPTNVIAYYNGDVVDSATILYPLATPIEIPLPETEIAAYRALHSNYPNTTVLNDAGAHMVVKYAADTKLYIDNKIAALTAQA